MRYLQTSMQILARPGSCYGNERTSNMEEIVGSLQQSFLALKNHFTPERRTDAGSNVAQLVIFAEHAVKVR